jgi:hypothetical protein
MSAELVRSHRHNAGFPGVYRNGRLTECLLLASKLALGTGKNK